MGGRQTPHREVGGLFGEGSESLVKITTSRFRRETGIVLLGEIGREVCRKSSRHRNQYWKRSPA